MQGFPVLPRYELNARLPERGTDLILKYERRPNQRPVSTLRPYLSIRAYTKSPRLLPHLGWGSRGLSHAIRYGAISRASRYYSSNRYALGAS